MNITNQQRAKHAAFWLPILICSLFAASCTHYKNIVYFRDVPDSLSAPVNVALSAYTDPLIQPNDILQVSIQTIDPQNAVITGTTSTPTSSVPAAASTTGLSNAPQTVAGFLVDKNGIIELPMVGKVNVGGKTTAQARDYIQEKAAVYFKEPVVNVQYANFQVTVLGEVTKPGRYIVPNEKVSLLDAIGMAGDLTIFGKRENVLLVRDENGQKKMVRLKLNSSELFQSPYFYLRQGDVVYVEPNKRKIASTDAAQIRNYSLITSIATVVIILITRINF